MTRQTRQAALLAGGVLVLLAASVLMDALLPSYHILVKATRKAAIYALAAVSVNLLSGFAGLFSLGQAGFMLLGAYAYAVLTIPVDKRAGVYQYFGGGAIRFSLPELLEPVLGGHLGAVMGMLAALAAGGVLAALAAWLIGLPVLRLKSDYLAVATLGFAEILRAFFQWNKLGPITNGSNLLRGFPEFRSTFAYLSVAGVLICCAVLFLHSTYGRALRAIRDDEVAAQAMGIDLAGHKRMAFVISAFFAGVSGGLLAMYQGIITAAPFKSTMTYEILLIVVIGGIGSVSGSVFASFLYVFSAEWLLRGLDSGQFLGLSAPAVFKNGFRMVVLSVIIMTVVLFFRRGLFGDRELPALLAQRKRRRDG